MTARESGKSGDRLWAQVNAEVDAMRPAVDALRATITKREAELAHLSSQLEDCIDCKCIAKGALDA